MRLERFFTSYRGSPKKADPKKVQREQWRIAENVIARDAFSIPIRSICGVDVAYSSTKAFAVAVLYTYPTLAQVEIVSKTQPITAPYMPTYFYLRELPPIISVINLLKTKPTITLVDGHGQLHPRYAGLASHVGVVLDLPTIGVAKTPLCGEIQEGKGGIRYIVLGNVVVGAEIKFGESPTPRYVSVGHRISLATAIDIVKSVTFNVTPVPLESADEYSKQLKKQQSSKNP